MADALAASRAFARAGGRPSPNLIRPPRPIPLYGGSPGTVAMKLATAVISARQAQERAVGERQLAAAILEEHQLRSEAMRQKATEDAQRVHYLLPSGKGVDLAPHEAALYEQGQARLADVHGEHWGKTKFPASGNIPEDFYDPARYAALKIAQARLSKPAAPKLGPILGAISGQERDVGLNLKYGEEKADLQAMENASVVRRYLATGDEQRQAWARTQLGVTKDATPAQIEAAMRAFEARWAASMKQGARGRARASFQGLEKARSKLGGLDLGPDEQDNSNEDLIRALQEFPVPERMD